MSIAPVRVIIADDHPIVRTGLQVTLDASPLVEVVGIAASFAEVLTCLEKTIADVVVLDLAGMGMTPVTMVARFQREYPNIGCLIFSSSVDLAPELLQLGILGYVVKEELETHLVAAICAVHAKHIYLSPIVQTYVGRSKNVQSEHHLAPQEFNVLKLVANGLTTERIAEVLGIGPRTVRNYIAALYRKTGCEGRAQLILWYQRTYNNTPSDA